MKKIILILFLFLSCYIIYKTTEKKEQLYLSIGDLNAENPYIKEYSNITEYNDYFISEDYRIIDLINIIKYNEEKVIDNKNISLHRLLKKADYLIISVGMNDIYSKLNSDTKNIYTYINDMTNNMDILLKEIEKYSYKKVLVLGYYNIENNNNDIFTYLNYKIKKITEKHNYEFIELNQLFKNNPKYYKNSTNFTLNTLGYAKINEIIVEKLKKY